MTGGEGVDVVLNSLAGESLRCSWNLLAPFGRFIEIGKKDIQSNSKIELRPLLHATSITCVDLVTMMKRRPALVEQLTDDTVKLWTEGIVKAARPTAVRPLSELQEGFQLLQSGKGIGKMVFVPYPETRVPIVPAQPPEFRLRQDATYVLSGGLGGLGRSIARWMASKGARHFLFLSSTSKVTTSVAGMKQALEATGCKVYIAKCDVSDGGQLQAVLEGYRASLPPIKGVVQGAMKLNDCIFENMTYEAWQTAVKPKVAGSWNLHKYLPHDLDHFVMLSSATGILGNRGQANYASGNTYQDMLAFHRRQQGLVASTVDVGAILSVGYVAENAERVQINKGTSVELQQIREEELHAIIEYAMDSSHCGPAQLVTGLTDRDTYRAKGMPLPSFMSFPLFAQLNVETQSGAGSEGSTEQAVGLLLASARTLEEAETIVTDAMVKRLATLLSVGTDDIDPAKSVSANGIDSLVAIEFRTFLVREVKADIPMLDIMSTSSIKVLSQKITSLSRTVKFLEIAT